MSSREISPFILPKYCHLQKKCWMMLDTFWGWFNDRKDSRCFYWGHSCHGLHLFMVCNTYVDMIGRWSDHFHFIFINFTASKRSKTLVVAEFSNHATQIKQISHVWRENQASKLLSTSHYSILVQFWRSHLWYNQEMLKGMKIAEAFNHKELFALHCAFLGLKHHKSNRTKMQAIHHYPWNPNIRCIPFVSIHFHVKPMT